MKFLNILFILLSLLNLIDTIIGDINPKKLFSVEVSENYENNENIGNRLFLMVDNNGILTPNYSIESLCNSEINYFIDIINKNIISLRIICTETYIVNNLNGVVFLRFSDNVFELNNMTIKKELYFDRSFEKRIFLFGKYSNIYEIENIPKVLQNFDFDLLPKNYNIIEDSIYIKYIIEVKLLGLIDNSNNELRHIDMKNNNIRKVNNDYEIIKIDIKDPTYLVFFAKKRYYNSIYIAVPIFHFTSVCYNKENYTITFNCNDDLSDTETSYMLDSGIYNNKGIKVVTNKIYSNRIISTENIRYLTSIISIKFSISNETNTYQN
ncbi:hypothetical protein RS030_273677 [Cryptosporidium xiaoi]|uniref:Uncharacterized protein n=1 Tax=Cryptosporidium xiaoi TaxID=659607 RepID=A0AAV9XXB5_9CRYT